MMFKRRVHNGKTTTIHSGIQSTGGARVVECGKSVAEAASEHQVRPETISRWRRQFLENAAGVFEKSTAAGGEAEARIAELERALGEKTLELEVAKKAANMFPQLIDG